MNRTATAGLALAALVLSVGAAQAHPRLLAANPAVGARVPAPGQVRMSFSETLIGRYSQIALTNAAGRPAPLGPSTLSPDHKQLVAAVRTRLPPGLYKVSWKAVSTDTHRVQGAYNFTVVR